MKLEFDDLNHRLTITLQKVYNNDPNDSSFELEVTLLFDGHEISSSALRIEGV